MRADSKHSSVVAPRLYDTDPPSNGRVMVADFSAGTPPAKVKYSEDWGKFTWLDGLDGDNDCHLAGDFTGSRHGHVLFLESAIVVGVRSVSSSSPSHSQAARPQREAMKKELSSLGLRIGSRAGRTSDNIQDDLAASVCRSSLTGAPFWLDTLTGVASLRLTAKKPEAPSSRSGGPSSDHA